MGCDKEAGNLNIERVLKIIKSVSIACGIVSIGSITAGILTLVYISPNFTFPYSSGSGIWAGVVTFLICVFGMKFAMKYRVDDPCASRCELMTFYGFIVVNISCGSMHTTYSGMGLGYCVSDTRDGDGELRCGDESTRLSIICGFSLVFGIFMLVTSIATMSYLLCGRKLQTLSGRQGNGGCCKW